MGPACPFWKVWPQNQQESRRNKVRNLAQQRCPVFFVHIFVVLKRHTYVIQDSAVYEDMMVATDVGIEGYSWDLQFVWSPLLMGTKSVHGMYALTIFGKYVPYCHDRHAVWCFQLRVPNLLLVNTGTYVLMPMIVNVLIVIRNWEISRRHEKASRVGRFVPCVDVSKTCYRTSDFQYNYVRCILHSELSPWVWRTVLHKLCSRCFS